MGFIILGCAGISGLVTLIALELILEHIEITGKKPWKD